MLLSLAGFIFNFAMLAVFALDLNSGVWNESQADNSQKVIEQRLNNHPSQILESGPKMETISVGNFSPLKFQQRALDNLKLRMLALNMIPLNETSGSTVRNARQNEDEEETEEDASSGDSTTSATSSVSTTGASAIIIPQVANIVKAIFGGNSINITNYVHGATKYLPPSIGNQVLGVVKLLVHNPSSRWTPSTTTAAPKPLLASPSPLVFLVKNVTQTTALINTSRAVNSTSEQRLSAQTTTALPKVTTRSNNSIAGKPSSEHKLSELISISTITNSTTSNPVTVKTKLGTDEEEEEEEDETSRQLGLPDLSGGLNIFASILNSAVSNSNRLVSTTESGSETAKEATASPNNIDLKEVSAGLGNLLKVLPDLFRGAREAVGLLSGIRSLLGSFGD